MLTLREVVSLPVSPAPKTPFIVVDCQISSIVETDGSFIYTGCRSCHSQKRTCDGDYCRTCDKRTENQNFFKVKVELDDSSGLKVVARVSQEIFEDMASAQSFSELLKPKQLSVLRVFFKPQSKYTVKLTRLQHDTKGLAYYIITSMQLQFPHSYRAMTIDPPARLPEPEVITLSSDSEHEQENKEPIGPSPSREASTISTANTTRKTVQPVSTPFRVDSNLSEDDEPLRKPSTITPRRKKRVIRDSSDEETPQDESTISKGLSPGKIRQLRPDSGSSEIPRTSGTLVACGGRTGSRSQLPLGLPTPRVSAEPSEHSTEDRQREKKKVFVPGYQTLAKRGSRYLPATIQPYSSAKVGEHLVKFLGMSKNETRPEYQLLRPSVWLTPGRTVQVSRARGDVPTSSRTREGRIIRIIGGNYVPKRYEVETEDSKGEKKISEFEFHLLSITDEEFNKECFDFLLQDEYLGSENMIVNVPEDADEDPPSTCSSNASNRGSSQGSRRSRSRPRGRKLKIGSDSTDEDAETDSFINDGPDLRRAKTPPRSPSRSPSRDNDFTYTKMPRRKGEIVFVKWRHENMYYLYSAATIIKKVADDTYVVRWIIPWKDTPTIEEVNILRVADVIRVGQRAIYMPGWDNIYEDEGTIYEVKGQGNKITVHMDVPKKNGHVAKKLFDVPLTELSFFADYVSRPSTSRQK